MVIKIKRYLNKFKYTPVKYTMNNLTPFTAEYKKRMNAVYKNIEKFNHKDIKNFNQIMQENIYFKLNDEQLIEKMSEFHTFTHDSLEHLIGVVNRNPQTFNGYGPYTKMDGYWKSLNISSYNNSPMEFQKKKLEYTKQIKEQKIYIEKLESQIEQLTKKQ